MKKLFFSIICLSAFNTFSQMEIVDVQTMTTYNSKVISYNGNPGVELIDANIIPTSQDAVDAVNNNSFGKWKLYYGPASRGEIYFPNYGVVSIRVCANTNNNPCMLVRTNNANN